jgi:hypothetical protein
MSPLIQAWQSFAFDQFPRILPGDEHLIRPSTKIADYHSFEEFAGSEDFGEQSTKFHLNLLPQPFVGNLSQASIYILLLNPGFSPGDYYALQSAPEYIAAIKRNLRQANAADAYPFFFLDPRFAWTAGGRWWQARFRSIAEAIAKQRSCSWQLAYQHISRHTACLEMYPYHSQSFKEPKVALKSTVLIRQYVAEELLPRAISGDALLVVTRQTKAWQLPTHPNIITYSAGEARGAHITTKTAGGTRMLQKLLALV